MGTHRTRRGGVGRGTGREYRLSREEGTADFDGSFEFEKHGLGVEDLSGSDAEGSDLGLGELDLLAFGVDEFLDDFVEVDFLGVLGHEK